MGLRRLNDYVCHCVQQPRRKTLADGGDGRLCVEAAQSSVHVVEREEEMQEWNEQKLPKVLPGCSGGRLPGRNIKEKGREEEEPYEGKEGKMGAK